MNYWSDGNPNDEARKIYLEVKGINANSLAKRFNEIVDAQSATPDAALYNAEREYNDFLTNVKDELKSQLYYQTCINAWQNVVDNIKTYGFYKAKEMVDVDLDGLEKATKEVDLWKNKAYSRTIGHGENTITAWIENYKKKIEEHQEIGASWQRKADEKKSEIDKLKADIAQKQEQDIKNLAETYSKDYNKFVKAYPEDEFVVKMEKMIKSTYGFDRYLGANTVIDLANKIAYGTTKNVFADSATKDEGVGK